MTDNTEWVLVPREVVELMRSRFTSCNDTPVTRAHMTREEFERLSAPSPPSAAGDGLVAIINDLRHSARVDDYELPQIAFIESIAKRLTVVAADATAPVASFQQGVSEWMQKCFIPSLYSNMTERGDRLLEEVLELLQAHGYDRERVATLVDYVYARPVGEPAQEVGGVMVTLAGFCWVAGLDMHAAGEAELRRITQPEVMEKIRRKQEAKNALHFDTPLPGAVAAPVPGVGEAVAIGSIDPSLLALIRGGRNGTFSGIKIRVGDDMKPGDALLYTAPPAPHGDGWQVKAAEWLERKAELQEQANLEWPRHAEAYEAWRRRPEEYRQLAFALRMEAKGAAIAAQAGKGGGA